jgi:hypothetical protein
MRGIIMVDDDAVSSGEDIDARILKISTGLSICEEWQHVSCGIFLMA